MQQEERRFTMRQMRQADTAQLLALYATADADANWLDEKTLRALLRTAEVWGCFLDHELCICGGVCRMDDLTPMAKSVRKTNLAIQQSALLLPCVATQEGSMYFSRFLQVLVTHCVNKKLLAKPQSVYSVLPVKTGSALLSHYFASGFTLIGMRPLYDLRAHYIFTSAKINAVVQKSIVVPISDPYTLSRSLEQGYYGTALYRAGGVEHICLQLI